MDMKDYVSKGLGSILERSKSEIELWWDSLPSNDRSRISKKLGLDNVGKYRNLDDSVISELEAYYIKHVICDESTMDFSEVTNHINKAFWDAYNISKLKSDILKVRSALYNIGIKGSDSSIVTLTEMAGNLDSLNSGYVKFCKIIKDMEKAKK